MKQRFSSLDIQVITRELSELVNLRVSNIYDLSSRIFLFKLAKPDHRRQFVVDSGFRCHATQYSRTTASAPSAFVARLRKFLKSRRLTSIAQIGTDRIIDLSFSDGTFHLFLEFFAGGNIILTDRELTILSVFRQVSAGEGEEVRLGLKYTVTNKQNYHGVPEITTDRIRTVVGRAKEAFAKEEGVPKKSKKKATDVLRKALSQGFPEYPPLLLDHAFTVHQFDPATPLDQVLENEDLLQKVKGVLEEAQSVSNSLSGEDDHPGYIIAKEGARPSDAAADGEDPAKETGLLYEDFHPFKPRQFEDKPGVSILEFDRFNATVDEYFSSIESQKLESRLTEREDAAKRKLDSVKSEHEKRIDALKDAQDLQVRKAGAIEDNMYRVQEAMDAVNGLIAQGMDWVEIARLIEMEQGRGNPVAKIIKLPLKLHENTITLSLGEAEEEEEAAEELFSSDESDEESESEAQADQATHETSTLTIDIDLGLSPWSNATQYYDQKKAAALKEQKTSQSSTKALKSHEKKVNHDLQRGLKFEKRVLRPARQPFWFEKFTFFISSEGYLVLGGHDALQTEILYRRYLKRGDIFINADMKGAVPIIVKNRQGSSANTPIPPSTLSQAGNLCVATSSAWDSKAVMSAWWVPAAQVSKTAAGGLLPPGDFSIKGEKNFLAPSQLVLGFGVMFQISKESLRNHKTQRFGEPTAETTGGEEETPAEDEGKEVEVEEQEADETAPAENMNGKQESSSESEAEAMSHPWRIPYSLAQPSEGQETKEQGEVQETRAAEEAQDDEDASETETPGDAQPAPQQGRDLSARERRLLRQGKSLDPAGDDDTPTPAPTKPPTKPTTAPASGKKGRSKKTTSKYAEQDEEERELALHLVGAKSAKAQKAAAAAETKANREQEIQAQKERRRAQHERAAEAERKRQAAFAAGDDEYDEETAAAETEHLSWLPALIGTPHPDDEILAAIPVCAPWAALGRYKYRVKLQPGTVKKGKAVKEMHGRWIAEMTTGKVRKEHAEEVGIDRTAAERLRAREGELLKGWKDSEIVNTLPVGKVRVMMPGGGGEGKAKAKAKGGGGGGGAKGGAGGKGGGKGGKGGKKK
ncbi:hypothetical protein PHISP_06997 [Aspergillus sp. HF37]|nr:hypothetical protein PHISP_06997 [Aspergillus sp. HF37]